MTGPDHPVPPRRPTLLELANNFKGATTVWAKAGFPISTEEEYQRRHKVCNGCGLWDSNAFGGVGKCGACGCSGFKLWLDTAHCPLGLWEMDDPFGKEKKADQSPPENV